MHWRGENSGRMRLTLGAFFKLGEFERRVDASGSRQNVRKETMHALHDPVYRFLQHGMASVLVCEKRN